MKYCQIQQLVGLKPPIDGYTEEEKVLETLLTENTVLSLYSKMPTARMKFILAAYFELGYPQELVAEMLGVKQPTLCEEIQLMRKILHGKLYKPHKNKGTIKVNELLKVIILLKNS